MKLSKGLFFSLLGALLWALSIVTTRIILKDGENAYTVTFWTSLLALPVWMIIFSKKKHILKKATRNDYIVLLAMGLISSLGVGVVEVFALKYSSAVNFAFLVRTVILFTIVFAYVFLGEKITRKKLILAVLILIGAYFLTTKGVVISLSLGDIFTLIEAACIALGNTVLGKMVANRIDPYLGAAANYLIGFLPIVGIVYINHAIRLPLHPELLILITLFQVLLVLVRFTAYMHSSASYITMVMSSTPVFVALMAIPFLGETLTITQIIGGLFIIGAGIAAEKLKI